MRWDAYADCIEMIEVNMTKIRILFEHERQFAWKIMAREIHLAIVGFRIGCDILNAWKHDSQYFITAYWAIF
jgi:hypothetical protein